MGITKNLLPYGIANGYENGYVDDSNRSTSMTVSRDTGAYSGNYCAKINFNNSAKYNSTSFYTTVLGQSKLSCQAYYKSDITAGIPRIIVQFWDSNKAFLSNTDNAIVTNISSWTQYKIENVSIPSNAVYAVLAIYNSGDIAITGNVWLDQCQLEINTSATTWVPGSTYWQSRTATSANKAAGNVAVTVNKPTNTADGELMLMAISSPALSNPTMPDGWTLIENIDGAVDSSLHLKVYYKIASSEGASYQVTGLNPTGTTPVFLNTFYGNTLSSTPFDKDSTATEVLINSTSQSVTSNSLSDVAIGNLVITIFASGTSSYATIHFTPPVGETEAYDIAYLRTAGMNFETQLSTGATGTKTATATASMNPNAYVCSYIASFNIATAIANYFKDKPIERGICRGIH